MVHTRLYGFLGAIKIRSAFTKSQKMGMNASISAGGSSLNVLNTASSSVGRIGTLTGIIVLRRLMEYAAIF